MDNTIDLLQIKIEKAKAELPAETINAIAAVDWRASILGLRERKGFTFEQLGDLELETELLLCGLVSPKDYPEELERRMGISKTMAGELVNEMNDLVFKKIREELIKNTERKKAFAKAEENTKINETQVLKQAGIKIIPPISVPENTNTDKEKQIERREDLLKHIENPPASQPQSLLSQKLSGSLQAPIVTTDHSLENISKSNIPSAPQNTTPKIPKVDPYREIPE